MMLRSLRRSQVGRPSPLARLVALLVVLGLVALTAPAVAGVVVVSLRWLGGLL